ncbi:MAG TPA: C40 family peptidase [Vicinamibacterales bacterium]|nr:C40 family peptidase [Vicinamibacterales bacterium]
MARHALLAPLALVTVIGSGCASATGVITPQPFPGAPVRPVSLPPASAGPSAATAPAAPEPDALVQTALGFQGIAYRLGGEDPASGFDCSGFVQYVFGQHHIDVPRTVAEQYQRGRRVALADVQAGDLLFFSTTGSGATHVGIALGPSSLGEFIHAPDAGGVIRIERFDAPYWRTRLVGVRRVL